MKVKDLCKEYGEDFEIVLSVYSCGNIFEVPLSDLHVISCNEDKLKVVFDAEYS